MDARASKNRLIETMRIERARWDMLLVQVGTENILMPTVEGEPSMHDILADLLQQERWIAGQLDRLAPDPARSAAETEPVEPSEPSRLRSVGELMAESRKAFEQIVRLLMRLPAEDIFTPQRYEWTGGSAVGVLVPDHTLEQYRRYDSTLRQWLTRKAKLRRRAPASTRQK